MGKKELSLLIKNHAKELGFELVGITNSEKITDFSFYNNWLDNNFAGDMDYLKRNLDKRENPSQIFENTKSIVCVGFNYYTDYKPQKYKIAKYALNNDYHDFMKKKLEALLSYIQSFKPEVKGRAYVDTAPILEKPLAMRAGLGWVGKNTLLINNKKGSYFLLGELFLDLELDYDLPFSKSMCGSCNKCISNCPTKALDELKGLDSNLCISYLTIESKKEIPENISNKTSGYIFGCDICQEVCPWNRFAFLSEEPEIQARDWIDNLSVEEILELKQEDFSKLFKNSPIKRAKLRGFLRNTLSMIENTKDEKHLPLVKKLTEHADDMVKTQAIITLKSLE